MILPFPNPFSSPKLEPPLYFSLGRLLQLYRTLLTIGTVYGCTTLSPNWMPSTIVKNIHPMTPFFKKMYILIWIFSTVGYVIWYWLIITVNIYQCSTNAIYDICIVCNESSKKYRNLHLFLLSLWIWYSYDSARWFYLCLFRHKKRFSGPYVITFTKHLAQWSSTPWNEVCIMIK